MAKKRRFSRNPSSKHFEENFLEKKRKSVSRNPSEPEDSSIRSVILKIVFSCNTPIQPILTRKKTAEISMRTQKEEIYR